MSDDRDADTLARHLTEIGHKVQRVPNDDQGVNALVSDRFDILIADLDSERVDGLRLLSVARDRDTTMPVVLLTDSLKSEQVLQAYDAGVTGVLGKPLMPELVSRMVEQGQQRQQSELDIVQLKRQLDTRYALTNLVGASHHTATLHDQIREAAPGEVPIILVGEPGTGRDHLAQIIHNQSARSRRSFVKVTFGSNTAEILERELFGCGAGVYPEVPEGSPGRIEMADQGSLYLDQLSELTSLRSELLLACIEKSTVQRLGETREIPVDIRLIVSVNSSLSSSDSIRDFLTQLQQKFGALTLDLAPLRDRREDIPSLVHHFADQVSRKLARSIPSIDSDVIDALSRYSWPGNLRELESIVEQMVHATKAGAEITYRQIPDNLLANEVVQLDTITVPIGASMQDAERAMIEATLRACNFDKDACAEQLGIGLRTLYRKLKEYRSADD